MFWLKLGTFTMAPLVQGSAQHGVTLGAALDVLQWAGAAGAV
jgi:hypothetical protein